LRTFRTKQHGIACRGKALTLSRKLKRDAPFLDTEVQLARTGSFGQSDGVFRPWGTFPGWPHYGAALRCSGAQIASDIISGALRGRPGTEAMNSAEGT
jgi:hypothetical protein